MTFVLNDTVRSVLSNVEHVVIGTTDHGALGVRSVLSMMAAARAAPDAAGDVQAVDVQPLLSCARRRPRSDDDDLVAFSGVGKLLGDSTLEDAAVLLRVVRDDADKPRIALLTVNCRLDEERGNLLAYALVESVASGDVVPQVWLVAAARPRAHGASVLFGALFHHAGNGAVHADKLGLPTLDATLDAEYDDALSSAVQHFCTLRKLPLISVGALSSTCTTKRQKADTDSMSLAVANATAKALGGACGVPLSASDIANALSIRQLSTVGSGGGNPMHT
eukprot:TRINITY_DN2513_c0_g1_i1.p1 TRINITY_DN2513_c0_g1~~TRINITY_DN2513_c0_g1_i1.p1  ORF type:complete len:292 (-),score=100.05 TRINITY_DN2513_c0_g1_i1:324-1157(-)